MITTLKDIAERRTLVVRHDKEVLTLTVAEPVDDKRTHVISLTVKATDLLEAVRAHAQLAKCPGHGRGPR